MILFPYGPKRCTCVSLGKVFISARFPASSPKSISLADGVSQAVIRMQRILGRQQPYIALDALSSSFYCFMFSLNHCFRGTENSQSHTAHLQSINPSMPYKLFIKFCFCQTAIWVQFWNNKLAHNHTMCYDRYLFICVYNSTRKL